LKFEFNSKRGHWPKRGHPGRAFSAFGQHKPDCATLANLKEIKNCAAIEQITQPFPSGYSLTTAAPAVSASRTASEYESKSESESQSVASGAWHLHAHIVQHREK